VIGLVYFLTYSLVSYATPAINDDTVTAVVKSNLSNDLGTSAVKIYVDTSGGIVTLKGTVPSAAERFDAEGITRNTTGVTDVVNHINVDTGP
jgi:hyperosmotically inducible periplasmic protein